MFRFTRGYRNYLDQGFGDLFVALTAGQVMTQASYATLEYAYLNLDTKVIVVLGHSSCGDVTAAVNDRQIHQAISLGSLML